MNRAKETGVKVNAGLAAFLHAFTNEFRGRPCEAIRDAWREARRELGSDSLHPAATASLNAALARESKFRCNARVAATVYAPSGVNSASALGGDPQPYIDAIDAVIASEPSTSSFISQIDAIVDDAELALTGDDLDLVYAVASVSVDSHDYWITQDGLATTADSLESAYGSCLTLEDDPPTCFYDASTRHDLNSKNPTFVRPVAVWSPHPFLIK